MAKVVLVCGSRDFNNIEWLEMTLDKVCQGFGELRIVHGGCRGADRLASDWAVAHGHECVAYPAQWDQHGKAAGPIRNQKMLDEESPTLGLVFLSKPIEQSRGSADMVRRMLKRDIIVLEIGP